MATSKVFFSIKFLSHQESARQTDVLVQELRRVVLLVLTIFVTEFDIAMEFHGR